MATATTVYQVWHRDSESRAVVGSRKYNNEQDAREHASDLDDYVIIRRSQETRGEGKVWTDLNVRVVEGEFWSDYLDEITDVEVNN